MNEHWSSNYHGTGQWAGCFRQQVNILSWYKQEKWTSGSAFQSSQMWWRDEWIRGSPKGRLLFLVCSGQFLSKVVHGKKSVEPATCSRVKLQIKLVKNFVLNVRTHGASQGRVWAASYEHQQWKKLANAVKHSSRIQENAPPLLLPWGCAWSTTVFRWWPTSK